MHMIHHVFDNWIIMTSMLKIVRLRRMFRLKKKIRCKIKGNGTASNGRDYRINLKGITEEYWTQFDRIIERQNHWKDFKIERKYGIERKNEIERKKLSWTKCKWKWTKCKWN